MRRNARCPRIPQPPRPEVLALRRGNSIVLVMGILVLLVIIATAFITRTHAGRVTSSVALRTTLRDDNARVMAEMLAQEISMALFPRPVDPNDPEVFAGRVADSNFPRLSPLRNPVRYGTDQDVVDNSTGLPPFDGLPDHPYNFAPYHVVPYTNPPDPVLLDAPNWPSGPGNPHATAGTASSFLAFEGNPVGNPGFGDARWLADHEPLRWDTDGDGFAESFSHWRHMTNIAHANNGFRIVVGIHDVGDLDGDGLGQLVTGLSDPVEQWLAVKPLEALGEPIPIFNPITGNAVFRNSIDFGDRWLNWFSLGILSYAETYLDPTLVPPNFYDLGDLDGDGFPLGPGERPQDEFVAGTARHAVSSILADTDGDGFTDSFWYLAPTMTERGIRQIVAVRIIDNSAMLNANVATRFLRNDIDFGFGPGSKTAGHTPADLALVGELVDIPPGDPIPPNWNVGFFDTPINHEQDLSFGLYGNTDIGYQPAIWDTGNVSYLGELGVLGNPFFPLNLGTAGERLQYWVAAGRDPLSPSLALTPFTFTEELELRMFNGQNYPWIASRFERAVQANVSGSGGVQFLHANLGREESSEYLDQLRNVELAFDHRRNLTMYNGARNDLMPPWLWRFASPNTDNNGDTFVDGLDFDLWLAGAQKFDLRLPPIDLDNDGVIEDDFDGDGDLEFDPDDVRLLGEIIRDRLERALIDVADESYYGSGAVDLYRTRRLAAAFAANILAYRDLHDANDDGLLAEAVAVVDPAVGPTVPRYLGLERQPFLLEAFIGHVHASAPIPEILSPVDPPLKYFGYPGNYVDASHVQSTIVVVQIANPFDEPINLMGYTLRVFGQDAPLPNVDLPPATEQTPATAIFYAIVDQFSEVSDFRDQWLDFLDLANTDHPSGTQIENVNAISTIWSTDRDDYVSVPADQNAIELLREDTSLVVIDRFDYNDDHSNHDEFRDAVAGLPQPPPEFQDPFANPPLLAGIRIGDDDYWVTWARATRAWGTDFNYDAGDTNTHGIQPNERAPRFVFARQRVTTGDDTVFTGDQNATPADDGPEPNCGYCGDSYADGDLPDSPWFDKEYTDSTELSRRRKPTFFNMNPVFDLAGNDIYPDFADPTYGYGSYFYGVSYPTGSEPGAGIPGKGFYHFSNSLQMLQKDGDFEQVGELLNVWLFGHEIGFRETAPGVFVYQETTQTFSEYMSDSSMAGTGPRVNRLRVRPTGTISPIIGKGDPMNLLDPLHAVPALPAGLRVLDAFVCDDRGVNGTVGVDELLNANGFTGKNTPGLINVNTAPVEVMRALPHMTRMVQELASPATNFYVRLPEAIIRYRERYGVPMDSADPLPAYGDRGDTTFIKNLRGERGIASIGEVLLLTEGATFSPPLGPLEPNENWRVDFAGLRPPAVGPAGGIESTRISTDVNDVFDPNLPGDVPDEVAQDAEELNLLFGGMSNMITTRSDVFTVYFRVRSFIQNPTTGVWDATNPEFIVDDSRFVMLIDRSEVNHPNDKPKILYLEKLPK